ncbi:MAG: chorismate mutase [Candidatus Altiarchaeota archaeon]|nr:chorismate mutase [Candidatus Altiarchaeota archaeon]
MPIDTLRDKIDRVDARIVRLLEERVGLAKKIGAAKRKKGLNIENPEREADVLRNVARDTKLNKKFVKSVFEEIIKYCRDNE